MSKVSTYLNFPGTAEAAFHFYQSIFGGEFSGGIHRFESVPIEEGQPPMSDSLKNMVLHVSLPIFDGAHVLMGSDAPAEMGFHVKPGNNMYINLQPDTRVETQRIFDALSEGGSVEQPLQDMFWGDFYGSCTDKFGVQWMFNCSEQV